ncbi:hypothetical protein, partial [Streptomyces sp. NPDC050388]|uniref:hypothetical protein n=1 Tax=Streptomyces sp. NPDC050388 TaxID=3155781 RepID=UPI00342D6E76
RVSALQRGVVGVSGGDTDADLGLTFLVMVRVGWLPVGMARGVLPLVRAVVAGPGGVWAAWPASSGR